MRVAGSHFYPRRAQSINPNFIEGFSAIPRKADLKTYCLRCRNLMCTGTLTGVAHRTMKQVPLLPRQTSFTTLVAWSVCEPWWVEVDIGWAGGCIQAFLAAPTGEMNRI
jgi:hypothetical protein